MIAYYYSTPLSDQYMVIADYYSTLLSDQLRGQPSIESDQICYGKASYCSNIMLHHTRLVRQ